MNVKTLAAVVGTLSLGALVTGCKTSSAASEPAPAAATTDKGASGSCGAGSCSGADKKAGSGAASTPDKGAGHSCSNGSCSGKK